MIHVLVNCNVVSEWNFVELILNHTGWRRFQRNYNMPCSFPELSLLIIYTLIIYFDLKFMHRHYVS
jgi:hypothetical protein